MDKLNRISYRDHDLMTICVQGCLKIKLLAFETLIIYFILT